MHSDARSAIRRAVAAGEFDKASELWEAYAEQLAEAIRGGTGSALELLQMRDLIDWTRRVVACAHAHSQLRINTRRMELHVAATYGRRLQ
jgi:hypothetical protein